ncbi:MAG: apolipoprotein N-acyltransferase [Desulfobacterales bacterium]|nr:apolipoprotein N-acyltransferase [Desulfobacterales bacterium]
MTIDSDNINRTRMLLAASSGLLLTASFPKIGLDWVAWVALVPLLISIRTLSCKKSFLLGFITGFVHYLTLVYWLVYTMKSYGNLPIPVAISVLMLMAAYLALYIAVFAAAVSAWGFGSSGPLVSVPLAWVSIEYLRYFLLSGFPWEFIGHSQFNRLHIIQISDILGVYGISFLIALSNVAVFLCYLFFTEKRRRSLPVFRWPAVLSALAFVAVLLLFWGYGSWRIRNVDGMISSSPSVRIGIVQANIDQAQKWDPAFQDSTTEKYIKLSLAAIKDRPELLVWPETATPFYFLSDSRMSGRVQQGVQSAGTDFLIGSPSYVRRADRIDYYNSAYVILSDGIVSAKYDKAHLVPFGEYVPLKKWLPFLGKMVENVGDFKTGEKGNTVSWRDYRIGIQICFEIIFPDLSRAMALNQAVLLVNITNDAWFGKTGAPYQHFSMAVFRAVENRRSLVRSANTGISGFVDPVGRIIASTPLFKEAVMVRTIPVITHSTFYTRYGDGFARGCLLVALVAALWKLNMAYKNRKT